MNRDELIAAMKADGAMAPVKVEIERWGTLYVRVPTVAEVEAAQQEDADDGDAEDGKTLHQYARAAARLLCDETGKRLFDPDNDDDVELLAGRRWVDLQKVLTAGRDAGN